MFDLDMPFFGFMTEIILAIALIITLYLSYLERKELNDRLMAKDLRDLKVNSQKEEPNQIEKDEEDNLLALEDARDLIEEQING